MAKKLLTVEDFRASAKDGGEPPDAMVVCAAPGSAEAIPDSRRVKFVFSDGSVDRAGDSIDAKGWQLAAFKKNPVALFGHDSSNIDSVMGKAMNVTIANGSLTGEIDFATADINPKADMAYRMVQAGILSAVSVGFRPIEFDWSTDKNRPYGLDFTKQELLEISIVPVPCNGNALIEARGLGIDTGPLEEWAERIMDADGKVPVPRPFLEETFRAAKTPRAVRQKYLAPDSKDNSSDWHVGAARDLPIDDSGAWDGPAAAARIFTDAGFDGDSPDAAKARRGFLLYDAANPVLKGSYKLPFADVEGGALKAMASGIRAAASRLPQTDAPADALSDARNVIDAYEARMKAGKDIETVAKAGRVISASTQSQLSAAIASHEQGIAIMKAMITDSNVDQTVDTPLGGDPQIIEDPMLEPIAGSDDGTKAEKPDQERERRIRLAKALKLEVELSEAI